MTWNESSGCVVLESGEAVLTRAGDLVGFMRSRNCGRSALRFVNCDRDCVRFYLDQDVRYELDPFRTFGWMKTIDYLVAWQKDPKSVVTAVSFYGGSFEWRITAGSGRKEFNTGSKNLDECAKRICARLFESVRPEPVRRLGADLGARKFVSDLELRRMLAI